MEDTLPISSGTVDLGTVRSACVRPVPARALGRDEIDDHAGGAYLVRRTPRPDRVLEDLEVASLVDSLGRMPTGSGAPFSATHATSGEAQAKVPDAVVVEAKRAASGKFMAVAPSATSDEAQAKVKCVFYAPPWWGGCGFN